MKKHLRVPHNPRTPHTPTPDSQIIPGTPISRHTLITLTHAQHPRKPNVIEQHNLEAHVQRGPYAHNMHSRECVRCGRTGGARFFASYQSHTSSPAAETFVCSECANEDVDGRRVPFTSDRTYRSPDAIQGDLTDYLLDSILARTTDPDAPLPHDLIAMLRERANRSEA